METDESRDNVDISGSMSQQISLFRSANKRLDHSDNKYPSIRRRKSEMLCQTNQTALEFFPKT